MKKLILTLAVSALLFGRIAGEFAQAPPVACETSKAKLELELQTKATVATDQA